MNTFILLKISAKRNGGKFGVAVFYPDIDDGIQHEIDRIQNIENQLKAAPKKSDLKETVRLLRDFKIKMKIEEIPNFATVSQLHRWRLNIIKTQS